LTSSQPVLLLQNVMISVRNLDRSVEFYEDVTQLRQTVREGGVAVLARNEPGAPMLLLRQATTRALHPGFDFVGVRSITWELPSVVELGQIEERLRARHSFRDRHAVEDDPDFEFLIGHDPDRLALAFIASRSGARVSETTVRTVSGYVYSIDA
jgi:catechol 2,3-dioxygenase-like lactoylglutathione lyase family enzyme